MIMIVMRRTDLAELYTLLGMYDRTYGGVPEGLTESVKGAYEAAYRDGEIAEIMNPRNADIKNNCKIEFREV